MSKKKSEVGVWIPPALDEFTHASIQALEKGIATDAQQIQALQWIVNELCLTYADTHDVDQRMTDHKNGRRFVGLAIVRAIKLNRDFLKKAKETEQ